MMIAKKPNTTMISPTCFKNSPMSYSGPCLLIVEIIKVPPLGSPVLLNATLAVLVDDKLAQVREFILARTVFHVSRLRWTTQKRSCDFDCTLFRDRFSHVVSPAPEKPGERHPTPLVPHPVDLLKERRPPCRPPVL
jgi:hypothetical protein